MTCECGVSKPDSSSDLLKEKLKAALTTLPPREQDVLKMRFGLEDGLALTLAEIGLYFNISPKNVRQIEIQALRRLRHPKRKPAIEGPDVMTRLPPIS
jgi:RNA polymerase primary sigma factor